MTMIKAQEVAFCTEKGYSIIDVRTEDQFEEGFIEGAVNVPLYQLIQGWEPFKVARRIGYAAFGVLKGTEPNPSFVQRALPPSVDWAKSLRWLVVHHLRTAASSTQSLPGSAPGSISKQMPALPHSQPWCASRAAEVAEVVEKDSGIVLCCNLGGDLKPPQDGVPGVQSRSLVAAYELVNDGYTSVKVLQDGINGWRMAGRDLWVADEDGSQSDGA